MASLERDPRAESEARRGLPSLVSPLAIQSVWMAAAAVTVAILILSLHLIFASRFTAMAQIAFDAGGRTIPVERIESFVAMPERIGRTVDKFGLAGPSIGDGWPPERVRAATRQRAIERIWDNVRIEQTDLTNVFAVRYTSNARRLAAPIVNDLADQIVTAAPGSTGVRAWIVFPATDPDTPDGSLFGPIVLALLGGALAAVAMLGAREWRQDGPRTARTTERMLGLPVAGMIPAVTGIPPGERASLTQMPVTAPQSEYARAFRHMLASGRPLARTVAVCSALAGEGKSTFAISFARTAALAGRRVAFVDCDGRVRAASAALGVLNRPGLIQVMDDATVLQDALVHDPHSPLMILGHSGTAEVRNFWSRDAMTGLRAVTEALADTFDLIVLDTPPLLALVEARQIAGLADEALLIARWRATPIAALRLAIKLLAGQNVRSSLVLSFVRLARTNRRVMGATPPIRHPAVSAA